MGRYIKNVLKLTGEEMRGHDFYDDLTTEETVKFLIEKVEAGEKVVDAFGKIKSLNSYQIKLHKEFGLSK